MTHRIEDRNGEELHAGDVVEFVYAGDYHRTRITKLHPSEFNHHRIEVAITALVLPGSVVKVRTHKKEETEDTAGEQPQPRETTSHRSTSPRSRSSSHSKSTSTRRK